MTASPMLRIAQRKPMRQLKHSIPKRRRKATDILNEMPSSVDDIGEWYDSLSDSDFDAICLASVLSMMLEENCFEIGSGSYRLTQRLVNAMRNRYRKMSCGIFWDM